MRQARRRAGAHPRRLIRRQISSPFSSTEKRTARISLVTIREASSFFTSISDWESGSPAGDHAAPGVELLQQHGRDQLGRGGNDDLVEGSLLDPSERAVAGPQHDIVIARRLQDTPRRLAVLGDNFDAVDGRRQARANGALIAQPGADLEDPVLRPKIEQAGHQRDDEGLGDGFAIADGQRHVEIGIGHDLRRNEGVARHRGHDVEHSRGQIIAAAVFAREGAMVEDFLDHHLAHQCESGLGHDRHRMGARRDTTHRESRIVVWPLSVYGVAAAAPHGGAAPGGRGYSPPGFSGLGWKVAALNFASPICFRVMRLPR